MTRAQLERFRKQLEALELDLKGRGPARIDPNREASTDAGRDEDGQPLNEMLQAIASGRNRHLEAELVRIRKALAKLRDEPDLFGLCEECEEPIARARLEHQPHAALCIACQGKRDGPRGPPTRRKLTDQA
jgi:DnaK suppressor protein